MNILKRAITAQASLSCHASRKCRFLLYSTTYTLNPPKPPKRSQTPPAPPRASSPRFSQSGVDEAENLTGWPRPHEIPYQAKVANLVNLIGHIRAPVKFQSSPDGKYWAASVISQENGADKSCLIPVLFEGNLAHVVTCHVKENDCVYVIGQLSKDPEPFALSEAFGNFHLRVQNINFVRGFEKNAFEQRSRKKFGGNLLSESSDIVMPLKKEDKGDFLSKQGVGETIVSGDSSSGEGIDDNLEHSWKDLVDKPGEWWDIRMEKGELRPIGPAFEHKKSGRVLCIDHSIPEWILKKLECVTFDSKTYQTSLKSAGTKKDQDSVLDSWKDLVQNSRQWQDYREQKSKGLVANKYPDFKHKDTGVAVWLSSAPVWALEGLRSLDFDVPPPKQKQVKDAKEELWKSLAENPNQWWDNRLHKKNPKAPDFKHKESGEGLWLNSLPDWVLSKLPPMREKEDLAAGMKNA